MYLRGVRPARALIVGGREVVRAGLERVLHSDPAIHVVGTAPTAARGLQLMSSLAPDVVVADQFMPDMGTCEFCACASRAGAGVLVLSGNLDDATIGASLRAGARGFVRLGIDGPGLTEAVRAVARGEAVLDPVVARRVVGWLRERPIGRGRSLSGREAEVLRLAARGLPDRLIASTLGVSHNTVKTYLRRALGKLSCRTRSEGAALAARWGLLDAGPGGAAPRAG